MKSKEPSLKELASLTNVALLKLAEKYNGLKKRKLEILCAELLAERGLAIAQFNLGLFYDEGLGVRQNLPLAIKWYRKAAKQGYSSALLNLGICYSQAEGSSEIIRRLSSFTKEQPRLEAVAPALIWDSTTKKEEVESERI